MSQISNIPSKIIAGLNVAWSDAPVGYPSCEYTMKYVLVNATGRIEITSAATVNGYSVILKASDTASWSAGTYRMIGYAEKSGEKYEVYNATIVVDANPFTGTGTDYRSHNQRVLEALQATIQGRATKEQSELTIGSRMIRLMSMDELIKAETHYRWMVKSESGTAGSSRKIYTVFR